MKNDVRLFIGDKEVEFSADPAILLNYRETELKCPTVVRNSFTKQIQVEGTNRNNDIFGHIWDLTRVQENMTFSPIQKTGFQLFVNDELFEKGYCKLDKVTRTNNTTQYYLTLYGNLGSFFYSLSYLEGSSAKKTLADLFYREEYGSEPDLSFTIDKDAVYEAWGQIAGFGDTTDDRWNVINFIPAYNGIPSDFDSSKVLINNYLLNTGTHSGFNNGATVDDVTYRPVINGALNQNGYSLGEAQEELTEWETRDLRSWMQRPCLSMYRFIEACRNPQNNGGFQVVLDSHFFHVNNPYYFDAWVTMPLLRDLDGVEGGETTTISGATISTASTTQYGAKFYSITPGTSSLASINNVNMNLSVRFTPSGSTTATNLYSHRVYTSNTTFTLQGSKFVKRYESNCGVVLQMFAYGSGGQVVGQSKAYYLGGSDEFPNYGDNMWDGFYTEGNDVGSEPEYVYLDGYWKKIDGEYVFVDRAGNQTDINFTFTAPSNFTTMALKVKTPRGTYTKYAFTGWDSAKDPNSSVVPLYTSEYYTTTGNRTQATVMAMDRVLGSWNFVVTSMEGIATDYEGLFSGTKISKERLLTTEYTPADYLLSYCKMFGLYFYFDSTEEADDPETYPSGVVHIMDRDTFYTEDVIDLEKKIDWNKKVEITPAMADAKWYRFDVEHNDSEVETGYKQQYGKTYGSQLVNTNYNFDNNTIDLYDGNVFRSGVMVLEKDKYFKKTGTGLPVYQYNGLTYTLFSRTSSEDEYSTYEYEYPISTTMYFDSINDTYEYYDAFPKLQFHTEDNTPSDGANVLVFLNGNVSTSVNYWLTDDITDMATLNDGTACWLMTRSEYDAAGTRIAYQLNYLPYFTRDLILFGSNYGNIVHSWNFGHPQMTYSPDTFTTEGDSIYDVCWKDYIRDLYNVDTRKLTCYVKAELDEKPWPYWLRRYYWFQNSIWRLNEIKDLNPGSFDTTKMEFIKVLDMDNYKLDQIEYQGSNYIQLDQNTLDCTGGTITGTMYLQSAGGWFAGDYLTGVDSNGDYHYLESAEVMSPYSGRGQTETTFVITVPANDTDYPITWTVGVEDDFDVWYKAYFTQETCNTASTLTISPTATTVGTQASSTTFTVTEVHITGLTYTSDADWLTLEYDDGTLTATYTANETATARTATITLSGTGVEGEMTATATLTQNGLGEIATNYETIYFDYDETGTTESFQVITDDNWTSTIEDNE